MLPARPKKTLFIKNLPTTTTEEEVKALSADILEARLESTKNVGDKKTKYVIIFIICTVYMLMC